MKKNKINILESIEKFRYSDSFPAVATKMILMTVAIGGIVVGGAIATKFPTTTNVV